MVRFSDLLGGNGDPEETNATAPAPLVTAPERQPEPEPAPEADPESPVPTDDPFSALSVPEPAEPAIESPQDVLDRLTQYATSARAGDQVPDAGARVPDATAVVPTAEETAKDFTPVADDLLPRGSSTRKPARGRKRRP